MDKGIKVNLLDNYSKPYKVTKENKKKVKTDIDFYELLKREKKAYENKIKGH